MKSGCDVLSGGRGAIKADQVCTIGIIHVTLHTQPALRSLSDYNQGLVILDQIRLFRRDLNAAALQGLQGCGWLQLAEAGANGRWSWPRVVT